VFEAAVRNTSLLTLGEICTAADDLRAVAGQYGAAYVAQRPPMSPFDAEQPGDVVGIGCRRN
jgi:hypothetical protein